MEKIKPTYEYYQGNCPVQMKEFFGGKLIAIYDGYLDKSGYMWKLYPKKKVSAQPLCPFRHKEITIFMAKTLERPEEPIPCARAEIDKNRDRSNTEGGTDPAGEEELYVKEETE